MMHQWASVWKTDLRQGEAILRQTVLSHVITAKHAAMRMISRRHGLIVEVTENDILAAAGNPLTQIAKLALKGLALNMAVEYRPDRDRTNGIPVAPTRIPVAPTRI